MLRLATESTRVVPLSDTLRDDRVEESGVVDSTTRAVYVLGWII
jgi:hypothetical protein